LLTAWPSVNFNPNDTRQVEEMSRYFILRDDEVFEEPDHPSWKEWYESCYEAIECIDRTELTHGIVSTHFLAVDMTLARDAAPQLFETRVTGGWLADQRQRYATLEEARAGHQAWVARVLEVEEENQLPPPGGAW
jgi:hypothetical protein